MLLALYIDDISFGTNQSLSAAEYYERLKPYVDGKVSRVIPLLRHWHAHWAKTELRKKITPQMHGAFENFFEAAIKHNLDVHAWSTCFLEKEGAEFLKQHPECHSVSKHGNTDTRLCRSQPLVKQYETQVYKEFLDNYPGIKGVVLDFIRFNEFHADCYCDHCLSEYKQFSGSNSREDFGFASLNWAEWRCGVITGIVSNISKMTKSYNVDLSAAVFPDWPHCRNEVGQDWGRWCRDGLVDAVMPMVYSNNAGFVEEFTKRHIKAAAGIPVYETIGVDSLTSKLSDEQVYEQCKRAVDAGAQGLVFYVGENPRKPTWLKKLSEIGDKAEAMCIC